MVALWIPSPLDIFIVPRFVGFIKRVLKLLSISRCFGAFRGALLILFDSPLDNYYYTLFLQKVNRFFKKNFSQFARANFSTLKC